MVLKALIQVQIQIHYFKSPHQAELGGMMYQSDPWITKLKKDLPQLNLDLKIINYLLLYINGAEKV